MQDIATLAWVLRQARMKKQITQTELGRRSEVPRGRISDIENGRRQPTDRELLAIAPQLDLSVAPLRRLKLEPPEANTNLFGLFCPQKLRYRMPRDRETSTRLFSLRGRDRAGFDRLWQSLRQREDWGSIRRFMSDVVSDSRHEIHAWMLLLKGRAEPAQLAPLRMGYRTLPVVIPRTHENVGDCIIPALVDRNRRGLVLPQVTVLTPSEYRMDGLTAMRNRQELRWCAVEIDGEGHDSSGDPDRTIQLRMPVIRFSAPDLALPQFADVFWERVAKSLWP